MLRRRRPETLRRNGAVRITGGGRNVLTYWDLSCILHSVPASARLWVVVESRLSRGRATATALARGVGCGLWDKLTMRWVSGFVWITPTSEVQNIYARWPRHIHMLGMYVHTWHAKHSFGLDPNLHS
jgi:hypothetical protein